jgi:hypothetical protein
MRVIGNRRGPLPGSNGPSDADVAASQEIAMATPRTVPKGILDIDPMLKPTKTRESGRSMGWLNEIWNWLTQPGQQLV